ncbi:LysR family transcriptional regulator [Bosea thiooxidans]|nr:LysR family transcriptional regulator [Bosea sp. (in: a-proteobacteria)]
MDRLDELAIFVAIIEAGSLAGAARRLRRSRPAITRALAALEDRVGQRLITRSTRRFMPSEAGRELATVARRLLGEYEASLGGISDAPVSGLLRLTAPLSFGRRHVTPLVSEFLDLYPQVRVELVLADRNLDLIEEDLHVAVRIGPLPPSRFVARKVGEVRRILVASPAYLAASPPLRRPSDIAAHETIISVATDAGMNWQFGGAGRRGRVALTPRLIVNEVESVLIAARAGRGLARPLSYQAVDDIAAGTLVRLLPEFEPQPLPVQLVTPGGRHLAPRVRAFIDHAVARLPRLAPISPEPWPLPG